jgi:hypothetical protein
MESVVRIAMWSGPRNISTAMMRSWGNRPDTFVCDEPFYAHYLLQTGLAHPGRDEVIAYHETDWRKVIGWLTGPIPGGHRIFYQKHMAHHLLPEMDRGWMGRLRHALLIRHPAEMLPSLTKFIQRPRVEHTGLPQQVEILDLVRRQTGATPPVVDARDVLENPRRMLGLLCEGLGVPFSDAMLSWPAGRRDTDGIWAKHWYAAVEQSSGSEPYHPKAEGVPEPLQPLLEECMTYYEALHARRLGR